MWVLNLTNRELLQQQITKCGIPVASSCQLSFFLDNFSIDSEGDDQNFQHGFLNAEVRVV